MYAILNDLFNYITPAIHLKGIGIGMKNTMVNEGTPLSSFLILRKTLTDKETGKVEWDDQSIADATRALIELAAKDRIKASEAAIATLDPKKDKGAIQCHESEIKNNKKILEDLACVSFDVITRLNNPDTTEDEAAVSNKALGRVYEQYYPEVKADERPMWIGLEENIRQRAGIILNLFREPGNKNQLFDEANIVTIEKMSLEDYEKLQEQKKAAELDINLEGVEIVNLRHDNECERRERYARVLADKRKREGYNFEEANDKMFDRNYFGMMMVETGEADALITGVYTKFATTLQAAKEIVGIR
jgi:hypothetical protein